ncbi:type II toxin-antitoxin system VapC family toxin [soil metagenome]
MSGNKFLIDTNIALYLLSGNKTIANILDGADLYLSFISELELLGYKKITGKEHAILKKFISNCIVIDINNEIKKNVVSIRQESNVKLPDAIIAGTAIFLAIPLLSADIDFKKVSGISLVLFEEI